MTLRYLNQVLFLASLVLFSHRISHAADLATDFQSDFSACSNKVTATEGNQLLSELRNYERVVSSLQVKRTAPKASLPDNSSLVDSQIRETQGKILRVLERLECKRLSQLSDPVVRGPAAPKPNFVEIRINYATDRLPDPDQAKAPQKDPAKYFASTLDANFKDFSYGGVKVTIPTQRKPGELNLPSSWSFVRQVDPERYFVMQVPDPMSRENFFKEMDKSRSDKESSLLLFVHGFNESFADAAMRTAQLAHDLQFPGHVMVYSWPSAGNVEYYLKDEDSNRISTPRCRTLLKDLLTTKVKHIYIVAHSMGTRIVIPTIDTLSRQGTDISKVSELMLAAADFNAIEFKDLAAAFGALRTKGTHVTIYAASNDFALQASRRVHSYARLGESDPRLNVFSGLDSIDASAAAPMRRAFGHSYVCDSVQVLGDMQDMVLKGLSPKERGLIPVPSTQFGWRIPKVN